MFGWLWKWRIYTKWAFNREPGFRGTLFLDKAIWFCWNVVSKWANRRHLLRFLIVLIIQKLFFTSMMFELVNPTVLGTSNHWKAIVGQIQVFVTEAVSSYVILLRPSLRLLKMFHHQLRVLVQHHVNSGLDSQKSLGDFRVYLVLECPWIVWRQIYRNPTEPQFWVRIMVSRCPLIVSLKPIHWCQVLQFSAVGQVGASNSLKSGVYGRFIMIYL
jgi:hypothetical protein